MRSVTLFFFALSVHAFAADYCSLIVRVKSPAGVPLEEVPVTVREPSGRVTTKDSLMEGAQFCDLGILPVIVSVGNETCNRVTVEDVPLTSGKQYSLSVAYDPEACIEEHAPSDTPYCEVLLRLVDDSGRWVSGATVTFAGVTLPPRRSDSAGRVLFLLGVGERLTASIQASGFTSTKVSPACLKTLRRVEQVITLKRNLEMR